MTKPLLYERAGEIKEMYEAGETLREIAEKLGTTINTVCRIKNGRYGDGALLSTRERVRQVKGLLKEGHSVAQVAEATGLSTSYVRTIRGKVPPAQPVSDEVLAPLTRVDQIKVLRGRRWSFQAIGDRFGITRQAVHDYLSKRDKG